LCYLTALLVSLEKKDVSSIDRSFTCYTKDTLNNNLV
jgi:hypothetical protein